MRVYNPDPEVDGWSSPHTVIDVVSDDMPFVVDSVTMALARGGYNIDLVIHPVIRVRRDADGRLVEVIEPGIDAPGSVPESVLHAEVVREPDSGRLARLQENVERVLNEVRAAVEDWGAMRDRAAQLAADLPRSPSPVDQSDSRR